MYYGVRSGQKFNEIWECHTSSTNVKSTIIFAVMISAITITLNENLTTCEISYWDSIAEKTTWRSWERSRNAHCAACRADGSWSEIQTIQSLNQHKHGKQCSIRYFRMGGQSSEMLYQGRPHTLQADKGYTQQTWMLLLRGWRPVREIDMHYLTALYDHIDVLFQSACCCCISIIRTEVPCSQRHTQQTIHKPQCHLLKRWCDDLCFLIFR